MRIMLVFFLFTIGLSAEDYEFKKPPKKDFEVKTLKDADISVLKKELQSKIAKGMFPTRAWLTGNQPSVQIELEMPKIKYGALLQMNYEPLSVTAGGKDVMVKKKLNEFFTRIDTTKVGSKHIRCEINKGIKADALQKAVINFKTKIPTSFYYIKLTGDKIAQGNITQGGKTVTISSVRNNGVSIRYTGEKATILGFDKDGAPLKSAGWSSSNNFKNQGFHEQPHTVVILIVESSKEESIQASCDLNKGQELKLPKEPTDNVRTRANPFSTQKYQSFPKEELDKLKPKLFEEKFYKGIQIDHSVANPHGNITWTAYAFGKDNKQVPLNRIWTNLGKPIKANIDRKHWDNIAVIFGKVKIKTSTKLQTIVFKKGGEKEQKLATGDSVLVSFNKNHIVRTRIRKGQLSAVAYDKDGIPLKKEFGGFGTNERYWGIPVRYEITVLIEEVEKEIPFELTKGEYDKAKFAAFKKTIKEEAEIAKLLMKAYKSRKSYHNYMGSMAEAFYFTWSKTAEPKIEVPVELLQSDPKGAKALGYTVKPYKGYHFTIALGTSDKGKDTPYRKNTRTSRAYFKGQEKQITMSRDYISYIAYPVDKTKPTFIATWSNVYKMNLDGKILKYVPKNTYNTKWVEVPLGR